MNIAPGHSSRLNAGIPRVVGPSCHNASRRRWCAADFRGSIHNRPHFLAFRPVSCVSQWRAIWGYSLRRTVTTTVPSFRFSAQTPVTDPPLASAPARSPATWSVAATTWRSVFPRQYTAYGGCRVFPFHVDFTRSDGISCRSLGGVLLWRTTCGWWWRLIVSTEREGEFP